MSTSLVQVRVEDSLRSEAVKVYEDLGLDLSTAIRLFLKRSVRDRGIPFPMTLADADGKAQRAYRAMLELSAASRQNGVSDMPLEEINREIAAARAERRKRA